MIKARVVVITGFETFGEGENLMTVAELDRRLAARFPRQFEKAIYYSPAERTWSVELLEAIQKQ